MQLLHVSSLFSDDILTGGMSTRDWLPLPQQPSFSIL